MDAIQTRLQCCIRLEQSVSKRIHNKTFGQSIRIDLPSRFEFRLVAIELPQHEAMSKAKALSTNASCRNGRREASQNKANISGGFESKVAGKEEEEEKMRKEPSLYTSWIRTSLPSITRQTKVMANVGHSIVIAIVKDMTGFRSNRASAHTDIRSEVA